MHWYFCPSSIFIIVSSAATCLITPLLLQFWDVIQLLDMRHVKSTDEMFEACLDHLEKANSSGVTEAFITVDTSASRVLTP